MTGFSLARWLSAAILALLTPAVTTAKPAPPTSTAPNPGRPLAERLEVAFRACSLQLTQRDYLTPRHGAELKQVGIALSDHPAPDVQLMAGRLFGGNGIYATVAAPAGQLWLVGSATVPACKVTVAETDLALTARYDWSTKLRKTAGWTYGSQTDQTTGVWREIFVLNRDRPGSHLTVLLDGPNSIANDGKGIQLIMTVAVGPNVTPVPVSAAESAVPATSLAGRFAAALIDVCVPVAATGSLAPQKAVVKRSSPPAIASEYPSTTWYGLAAAPDAIFLSLDAVPNLVRCRIVLDGATGPIAHEAAAAALQRAGARPLAPMAFAPQRHLMESVWALPRDSGATLILVQTAPAGAAIGRSLQASATAKVIARAMSIAF